MDGTGRERSLRISDAEREAAVRALDAHRVAGRIDAQEYEDRSVTASSARTWSELDTLFADLPEPHPRPGEDQPPRVAPAPPYGSPEPSPHGTPEAVPPGPPTPAPPVPSSSPTLRAASPERSGALGRWSPTVVAATPILAVILFFTTHSWLWFLAIPLVSILVYGGDRDRRR